MSSLMLVISVVPCPFRLVQLQEHRRLMGSLSMFGTTWALPTMLSCFHYFFLFSLVFRVSKYFHCPRLTCRVEIGVLQLDLPLVNTLESGTSVGYPKLELYVSAHL